MIQTQRNRWAQEYPGGAEIARTTWEPLGYVPVAVRTARKLNHAVVAIGNDNDGVIRFVALQHPSEKA